MNISGQGRTSITVLSAHAETARDRAQTPAAGALGGRHRARHDRSTGAPSWWKPGTNPQWIRWSEVADCRAATSSRQAWLLMSTLRLESLTCRCRHWCRCQARTLGELCRRSPRLLGVLAGARGRSGRPASVPWCLVSIRAMVRVAFEENRRHDPAQKFLRRSNGEKLTGAGAPGASYQSSSGNREGLCRPDSSAFRHSRRPNLMKFSEDLIPRLLVDIRRRGGSIW